MVLPPFSFIGTLPSSPVGGNQTIDRVESSGEKFRYHIWTEAKSAQLAWYNLGVDIEVVAVAGGLNGDNSSYTVEGTGGLGGEYTYATGLPVTADYQIFSVQPGGVGEPTTVAVPGLQKTLSAGQSTTPLTLDAGWKAVLGYDAIGGKGPDNVGPVDATNPGGGGAGGFKLKEPYPQQSYVHRWTTGGPYSYDCSYGAGCRQVSAGTSTHQGDARPCNGCPGHAHICHGPCDCMFAWYHSGGESWASRGQGGCPGGWYACGCHCCTDTPKYTTVCDVCNSGGSASGGTCRKTCSGDNTQHHSEVRWTACNSGYTSVSNTCTDSRPTGGGKGKGGIVAIRYKFDPDKYVVPEAGTGVPLMY